MFSAQGMAFVRAMDEFTTQRLARYELAHRQSLIKYKAEWSEADQELSKMDNDAVVIVEEIEALQNKIANSTNDLHIKLLNTQLQSKRQEFDNLFQMIETKTATRMQYNTVVQQARLLEHLSEQPEFKGLKHSKALLSQRQTRNVLKTNKKTMNIINTLSTCDELAVNLLENSSSQQQPSTTSTTTTATITIPSPAEAMVVAL